jgi:hypothetical protein
MSFAVVTVETEYGDRLELALALEIPSRTVAANILRDLGRTIRIGDTYLLYIETPRGDKPIPPTATLGAFGITDGQRLRLKRQVGAAPTAVSRAYAYLKTQTDDLLPLESSSVIIGRKDAHAQIPLDLDLSAYDPGHALSRRHASIGREGPTYYLIDLNSTNGTRLNEVNLVPGRKMPLQDGDSIEFGLGMRVTFVTAKPKAG